CGGGKAGTARPLLLQLRHHSRRPRLCRAQRAGHPRLPAKVVFTMDQGFFKGRKVVVTGGSGFVGTHFVEALLAQGAVVKVPLHRREMIAKSSEVETVRADLTSQESCRQALQGAEIVIHAAGAVSAAGV